MTPFLCPPFFQAIQREVLKRLRPLVEEERKQEAAQRAQIENRETRRRLNELEKLATRFMQDHQEEDDDLDNPSDNDRPHGARELLLSPPFAQMIVGQTRRFSLTVNQSKYPELAVGSMVQIQCETAEIHTNRVSCPLELHPGTEGLLRAVWEITAVQVTSATGLVVRSGSIVANSTIEVLASERDRYADVNDLRFHRKRYRLRPGHPKQIRLLAPYPGSIKPQTAATFKCDATRVKITGDHVLHLRDHLGILECKIHAICDEADIKASLV